MNNVILRVLEKTIGQKAMDQANPAQQLRPTMTQPLRERVWKRKKWGVSGFPDSDQGNSRVKTQDWMRIWIFV